MGGASFFQHLPYNLSRYICFHPNWLFLMGGLLWYLRFEVRPFEFSLPFYFDDEGCAEFYDEGHVFDF